MHSPSKVVHNEDYCNGNNEIISISQAPTFSFVFFFKTLS